MHTMSPDTSYQTAVALLDRNGLITSVNAAWRSASAMHPLQCSDYLPGADYIALCASARCELGGPHFFEGNGIASSLRAVLSGELQEFQMQYVSALPEGLRTFRMSATAMDDGAPAGVMVTHADITEGLAAELGLRQSAGLLQSVIDGIPDAFYVKDLDGRYLLANRALANFAKSTPQQVIGSDHLSLFGSTHAPIFERVEKQAIATRTVVTSEAAVQTAAGIRTFLTTTAPHLGAGGAVIGVIAMCHDISIRKAAEVARDEERRTLRTLIDALPDLIYTKDMEGRYVITNRAAHLRFGGRSHAQMAGRTRNELEPSAASSLAQEDDGRVLGGQQLLDRIASDVDAQGRRQWRLVIKVPLRNPAGLVTGLVGIERDITALRADQEALRSLNADLEARVTARTAEFDTARDEAEQANRAKSIFLATMSHEIRTPMNGVIGMLDVLHQTSLQGHQVEMVDLISESAFSLLAIIDDILDFSKMEAGKLSVERVPMVLRKVVEKACAMLDDIAMKRGVRLTVFVDPAIPLRLMGDAGRLRQLLVNLTTNAIKFSGDRAVPGRVSVRVLLQAMRPGVASVELVLTDNGIGMDQETQSRLFQPFTQADATTTRRFGGTGLGLAISSMLVDLMGGTIDAQSQPGHGSTFTVRLDLDLAESPALIDNTPADPGPGRYCVVGAEQPLAGDIAAMLAGPGSVVLQAADTAGAAGGPEASGGWTWVVLPDVAESAPAAIADLHRELRAAGAPTRFITLGWGKRRHPRIEAPDLVHLDADNLTLHALHEAMAAAVSGAVTAMPAHDLQPGAGGPALSREEASRQGRLILVAEDNETNRRVIQQQIRLSGHAADFVTNGQEALERWRTRDYALILTDLNMPVMDGFALARAVRKAEGGNDMTPGFVKRDRVRIPIVAFTANALPQEGARCKAAGMDDYLVKPVRLARLVETLARWVGDAPPDAGPLPPLDLAVLRELVGDDPLVSWQILESFLQTIQDCQRKLHEAVSSKISTDAATALHSLKSASHSVGGEALAGACTAMEFALAQHGTDGLESHLPALDLALGAVGDWTKKWLATHPSETRQIP